MENQSSGANNLYSSAVVIDKETGLPADYDSLAVGYKNMVTGLATTASIPVNDREDAAQTIFMKFWEKGGLNFYRPEEHQRNGRKPKFSTLFRSWASMFMLQEKDKVIILSKRRHLVDSMTDLDTLSQDHSEEIIEEDAAVRWVQQAKRALDQENRLDLVPVLEACVDAAQRGAVVTRADIVQATGVSLRAASGVLKQLRTVLETVGMGAESLT